jgi:flavin reductase (DIM6/NTAB) family NADH-FMN oxidoreductase RutF
MPAEIVRMSATAKVVSAAEIVPTIAAVIIPGRGPIADSGIGDADEREPADHLARLLTTVAAGHSLDDVAHRHALFGALAACGAMVFVECHASIVAGHARAVNPRRAKSLYSQHYSMEAPAVDEHTEAAKKTTLRMIPYGLYVLAAKNGDEINAGAINWVTQTSFAPPLVVMGVKKDSGLYSTLKASGTFALSFLESGQKDLAFGFFKPTSVDGHTINGQAFETHQTGAPVITAAPAFVEGKVIGEIAVGDHSCVVGEVTNAVVKRDAKILTLDEAGVKYGG